MLQFSLRSTGLLLGCLIVTFAFAEGGADKPLPATPPVGGFTGIGSVNESTPGPIPAPIPEVSGTAIGGYAVEQMTTCGQPVTTCGQPVTTCGQPVATDCNGHCGHGHCGHCRKRHCIRSTGDMYPHFPYYPEHHGYYYFRPYNYTNVQLQRSQGLQLGVSPANPYSVSMLNPLFERFSLTNLSRDDDYDRLPSQRSSLRNLEELLDAK